MLVLVRGWLSVKKTSRAKLVLNKDVVRVLSKEALVGVAGAAFNIGSKLDECVTQDGNSCWETCVLQHCTL